MCRELNPRTLVSESPSSVITDPAVLSYHGISTFIIVWQSLGGYRKLKQIVRQAGTQALYRLLSARAAYLQTSVVSGVTRQYMLIRRRDAAYRFCVCFHCLRHSISVPFLISHSVTTQKTVIDIFAAVRNPNFMFDLIFSNSSFGPEFTNGFHMILD